MSVRSVLALVNRPLASGVLLAALLCSMPGCIQDADGRRQTTVEAKQQAPAGLTFEQWATVDARGAADAMAAVRRDIEALDPSERAEAAESLAVLQVTCPYTRASLQLALALHLEAQHLDKAQFDGLVHPEVDYLKRGLADHVAVLDALQVQLPLPGRHDGLDGVFGLVDRAQLEASESPVATTAPLVESVPDLVESIENVDLDRIRKHSHIAQHATGHLWTFQPHLMGWRTTLARLEPFVQDDAARQQVRKMLDALDTIAGMGC